MTATIIKPFITEKSLSMAAGGWYTFVVAHDSDKGVIASAISKFYKVTVTEVRTVSMHGKMRRVGRQQKYVKKSDWKKAMVHLKKGQTIDAFEVTATQEKEPAQSAPAAGGKK